MDEPDYKATTNLPKTDFAMKANLPVREPLQVAAWLEAGTYAQALRSAAGAPFVLHDGPPYANGHIHQGHMLNKVLKDVVAKYQTMSGRPARLVPGWDCHGLPIELAVDKALGSKKRELSKVAIRQACREHAERFIELQKREFQRLGVFMDWEQPYVTMSFGYEAEIVRQLARVARAGALYRGKKPVYWCVTDRTALAEAEVEYEDHDSPSIYVGFALLPEDRAKLPGDLAGRDVRLAIWTTTPWTLPANLAIAAHPSFEYV
ncbi:MAG: class I tRNA ligase family protein, partial [Deltaproteobacteria bacterium]